MNTTRLRKSERNKTKERDPKHQNSINPLRRSLKGFLKADAQHTEAFQVNTVCGGNAAEAFMLYALTFPLCYFLFLHLSHAVCPSLRLDLSLSLSLLFSAFLPASLCCFDTTFTVSWIINLKRLLMNGKRLQFRCIRLSFSVCFFVHESQIRDILEEINDNSCAH